jgi:multisubunit Na+/H+ antiporter MnhG subunit
MGEPVALIGSIFVLLAAIGVLRLTTSSHGICQLLTSPPAAKRLSRATCFSRQRDGEPHA